MFSVDQSISSSFPCSAYFFHRIFQQQQFSGGGSPEEKTAGGCAANGFSSSIYSHIAIFQEEKYILKQKNEKRDKKDLE
ncbi:MAG: hypothetical protein J6S53_05145 [Lentisphaeria bacterium]|nr:hypothetical protein [Lentisphaeria bacterium]